jgi:hypothetical protein
MYDLAETEAESKKSPQAAAKRCCPPRTSRQPATGNIQQRSPSISTHTRFVTTFKPGQETFSRTKKKYCTAIRFRLEVPLPLTSKSQTSNKDFNNFWQQPSHSTPCRHSKPCCSTYQQLPSFSSFSFVSPSPDQAYSMSTALKPPVVVYNRHRLLPILAPILPSSVTSRLAHYTPLSTFSFSDQVAAGLSSGNFDVERDNLGGGGSGSSDSRMGMDEAGVEEVRRIM